MDIKVTTEAGGIYIIRDASIYGQAGLIGHTDTDPSTKIFELADTDKLERI